MPPLQTRRRIEFRDTDAAGIAHFSAFFFWMESAEHELLRAAGVAVVERDTTGVEASWPRVSASCDYVSAVRFGEEVDIAVAVEAIGRTSVTYGFAFSHAGVTVARGRIVAVRCLDDDDDSIAEVNFIPDVGAMHEAASDAATQTEASAKETSTLTMVSMTNKITLNLAH
jgi:4-hydroxybenzoyl-CoA thioesterase/acyl-CoA thioester hydrolase